MIASAKSNGIAPVVAEVQECRTRIETHSLLCPTVTFLKSYSHGHSIYDKLTVKMYISEIVLVPALTNTKRIAEQIYVYTTIAVKRFDACATKKTTSYQQ